MHSVTFLESTVRQDNTIHREFMSERGNNGTEDSDSNSKTGIRWT